jgi:hypothetical protein
MENNNKIGQSLGLTNEEIIEAWEECMERFKDRLYNPNCGCSYCEYTVGLYEFIEELKENENERD